MENINYLSLIADILAIVSLILAMYFYYSARTKEIDELRKIVESKSKDEFITIKNDLNELKRNVDYISKETLEMVKTQFSFMQQQVGKVGEKSPTKPEVEILDTIMRHKRITVETLCMQFNHMDRFIVIKYVEEFQSRGTLKYDGTLIQMIDRKDTKDDSN